MSLPLPPVTEAREPAPTWRVRLLVSSPRLRLPEREPPEATVTVSLPAARLRVSKLVMDVPSTLPPSAPLRVRELAELLVLRVSVPAPPARFVVLPPVLIVAVSLPSPRSTEPAKALLKLALSSPPSRFTVSKLVKLVDWPLPDPLAPKLRLFAEALKLRVSLSLPPAMLPAEPPLSSVTLSLPAPRSMVPLKPPCRLDVSTPAPRLMVSKPLSVRLASRFATPPLETVKLLLPAWAVRLSLPLPPTKTSKPETLPPMPVAPVAAMLLAPDRVTEAAALLPA